MGGVLSLGSLACCMTGTCVSTTCAICPSSCAHSGLAKFMYALVLLVTVVIACIMLAPGVETWLNKSPFCEPPADHSAGGNLNSDLTVQKAIDYGKELLGQATKLVKLPCEDAIGISTSIPHPSQKEKRKKKKEYYYIKETKNM